MSSPTFGQSHKTTLKTDLFDPLAKGGSLWINADKGNHRIFLASGFNELPDFLNPDKPFFTEKRDFFQQMGYGHRIGKHKKGIFGVQLIYQDMTIRAKGKNEQEDLRRQGSAR